MDDFRDETPMTRSDAEVNELLGLFDAPAFARRGQDLEHALGRFHGRCRRERSGMLEMPRTRLRQWAGAATGPDDWRTTFTAPIDRLWSLCEADPPVWAEQQAPARRRRAIGRDLIASVERFNRRWSRFLNEARLEPINRMIEHYNRYYLLEKECVLGSARLAARHFSPRPPLTHAGLLAEYPPLPVPELIG